METVMRVLAFLKDALLLTTGQLVSIFGIFFFFGLILYLLARFTRVTFVKSIGQKFDIYITGWIGTPVHEVGHAIFCYPFGHKITELKLFSPNAADGSLGYVNHSYNPKNIWHLLGNFFIGFGPILFGSLLMFLLIRFLVPDNGSLLKLMATQKVDLSNWHSIMQQLAGIVKASKSALSGLFSSENIHSWQFWAFLYLALCIASHMELSPADLKGLLAGLLAFFIVLFIVNMLSLGFDLNTSKYITKLGSYSHLTSGIFTITTLLSLMFFVFSYFLLNVYSVFKTGKIFHPFA